MKRIRLLIMTSVLLLGVGAIALPAGVALADSPTNEVCTTLGSDSACGSTPKGSLDINQVIGGVINILSEIVGIVAVIMVVVGGYRYITSNGDSGKISSARNTIMYALIGAAIAVMAQVLVQFVFSKAATSSPGTSSQSSTK